jgi:hypothetical protein
MVGPDQDRHLGLGERVLCTRQRVRAVGADQRGGGEVPDHGVRQAQRLLDRRRVEPDLPAHALGAAAEVGAPVGELAAGGLDQLGTHGSITILSASRRSYTA